MLSDYIASLITNIFVVESIVMQPPSDTISDVWFRCPADLAEIVEALGLSDVNYDAENYWEWAIGTLDGVQLDVTRTHQQPAATVDTRIFRLDNRPISNEMLTKVVERLRTIAHGRVSWGRWVYRQGNEYELQAVGHTASD